MRLERDVFLFSSNEISVQIVKASPSKPSLASLDVILSLKQCAVSYRSLTYPKNRRILRNTNMQPCAGSLRQLFVGRSNLRRV